MFTGIVTAVGRIAEVRDLGASSAHGKQLVIEAPAGYLQDVGLGDSIALNGACMTATQIDAAAGRFAIDISAESLARTAGLDRVGPVNLEKALRAHDRLGGHIVSGHVDGMGRVTHFAPVGESLELRILAPRELAKYLAYKGSITVNGEPDGQCRDRPSGGLRNQHQPDSAHGAEHRAACADRWRAGESGDRPDRPLCRKNALSARQ